MPVGSGFYASVVAEPTTNRGAEGADPGAGDREARIVAERRSLPDAPGVYLFRDRDDEVIYVGKAISIRKRDSPSKSRRGSCA